MTIDELDELIIDLMIKYGPDGHCDGHEIITKEIWKRVAEWSE